jgi:predicted Zn-dependent protease
MTGSISPRPGFLRFLVLCLGLAVTLSGAGCGADFGPAIGEGPGHRRQELGLTAQQELEVGRRAYREVLSKYQGRILPADSSEVRRARQVTARVVKAAGIEPLQREINLRVQGYRFEWEVNVLEDRQINAFCLPGGKIAVFTGLFNVVENDDQLATVLSHEISHALAHHASERIARANKEPQGANIASFFINKKHDRDQEAEADKIGVFLMTFAGYDPREAIVFWERMQKAHQGGAPPEILSDHPSNARRIHDMQDYVRRALAAKRAFDQGRIAPARSR